MLAMTIDEARYSHVLRILLFCFFFKVTHTQLGFALINIRPPLRDSPTHHSDSARTTRKLSRQGNMIA